MPAQVEPRSALHGWSMSRDLDQGFTAPWGERGQIKYRPNGWSMTRGGVTTYADDYEPTQTQTQAIDPRQVIDAKLGALRDRLKQWSDTYRATGVDAATYNRNLVMVQREYNREKAELTGTTIKLDRIQQLVTSGAIPPEVGYEVSVRSTVSKDIADAMFPTAPTPGVTGTSPAAYESLVERFTEVGETLPAYKDKAWYRVDVKQLDSETVKDTYFAERRIANLDDPRNANRIPGFNAAFAEGMSADPRTKKAFKELIDKESDDSDIEMIMAFAPKTRLGDITERKVRGPVSPLGRSIAASGFRGAGAGMTYPYTPKRAAAEPVTTEDFSVMSDEELRRIAGGR